MQVAESQDSYIRFTYEIYKIYIDLYTYLKDKLLLKVKV